MGLGKFDLCLPCQFLEGQISCNSAEAGVVVVVGVSKVEMYSDGNLHLKRQNVVTLGGGGGGDLSFL